MGYEWAQLISTRTQQDKEPTFRPISLDFLFLFVQLELFTIIMP